MSYSLYVDGALLYAPGLDEYRITDPIWEPELNKAGRLSFTIYPDHPNFARVTKLLPTIVLKDGDAVKFRGRPLNDELGWENQKDVVCEGELAFFNDSVQRPFSFPLDAEHATPADYFAFLVNRHNAQVGEDRRFIVGNCTVTDPNGYIARSDTEYSKTWTLLKEGLLDKLGGYLWVRHEADGNYIDYLADFNVLGNQAVEFGVNLLAIKTSRKGEDIAPAILPLGHQDVETGERVTIAGLADSETDDICKTGDYVYSKIAVAQYGFIIKTVSWDDVTLPANLLSRAVQELVQKRMIASTVTLTAADLSAAGYDFNTFSVGTYVDVVDDKHPAHDLLARYLVKRLSVNWLDPTQNKLTLGATTYSMTERSAQQTAAAMQRVEASITAQTARVIREVEQRNTSAIEQSSEAIMLTVTEGYYTKEATDRLVGEVSTEIEQTADGINIRFSSLAQDIDDVAAGADAKFESLQSYIQMAGGSITLGELGNEVTLKIENDRIGIYSNGVLITYWTAQDFVAPKTLLIPVGGRLILGEFAYIPRSNGSLDFTWVGK